MEALGFSLPTYLAYVPLLLDAGLKGVVLFIFFYF